MNSEEDFSPKHSPLSQSITREGKTVNVIILDDGSGKWILEIEDEFWSSTVWGDLFDSDEMALKEAIRVISEEGISSFINPSGDAIQ